MPTYTVKTKRFGDVLKEADSIREARKWATKAFPREVLGVTRLYSRRLCVVCDSRPCVCPKKTH